MKSNILRWMLYGFVVSFFAYETCKAHFMKDHINLFDYIFVALTVLVAGYVSIKENKKESGVLSKHAGSIDDIEDTKRKMNKFIWIYLFFLVFLVLFGVVIYNLY